MTSATKWARITSFDNGQLTLFIQSKAVYETLFPWGWREPWENFETYIRDTEARRSFESPVNPEDHYYVGTSEGRVWGMMFFTTYPGELGFVAYMGVAKKVGGEALDRHARNRLVDDMPNVIATAMNAAGCGNYLFELEKVSPEDLGRTKHLTDLDKEVRDRILVTNAFQRKGARKLGWVTYRQPKLEWNREDQEIPMHLMYALTSKFAPVPPTLTKKEVMRFIRFVYLKYYMEGFEASEIDDVAGISRWREYLTNLNSFSLRDIPKRVALQPIDLSTPKPSVFVSYSQGDLRKAQLIQEYLETLGIPVFYWERGKRFNTGKPVWEVIEGWMKSCDFLVFLLTKNTYNNRINAFISRGQKKEVEFARRNFVQLGQIKPLFSVPISPSLLEKWFRHQIIGMRFSRATFHQSIEDLARQLLVKPQK